MKKDKRRMYQLARSIPVEKEYDIVVAGGGQAGSAAAICAARLGARVLLVDFFRKYVSGCENMEFMATGALMGIRESRRIVGEYELCYDDYRARRHFPDQIAVYCKQVDIYVYDCSDELVNQFPVRFENP